MGRQASLGRFRRARHPGDARLDVGACRDLEYREMNSFPLLAKLCTVGFSGRIATTGQLASGGCHDDERFISTILCA